MKYEEVKVNSERWFDLENLKNEIWNDLKIIKSKKIYDYKNLYKISNYGRVKSLGIYHGKTNNFFKKEHILKARKNRNGYIMYCLCNYGKTNYITAHRAVATTFIDSNNKKQVNHINGDKTDNRVENLEWCTASENMKHAYNTGLKVANVVGMPKEKNPNSKFTEQEINEIREKRKQGCKLKDLAKQYNTYDSYISRICKYCFWK